MAQLWQLFRQEHLFFNGCAYTLGLPISAKLRGDGSQCVRAKRSSKNISAPIHLPRAPCVIMGIQRGLCARGFPLPTHSSDLSDAAVSSGLRRDLNFLPRDWTWVAWMKPGILTTRPSKGLKLEAIFPWIFSPTEKCIYHRGKNDKCMYKVYYLRHNSKWRAHRESV